MRSWRKNVGRTEDANLAGECTVVTLLLRGDGSSPGMSEFALRRKSPQQVALYSRRNETKEDTNPLAVGQSVSVPHELQTEDRELTFRTSRP